MNIIRTFSAFLIIIGFSINTRAQCAGFHRTARCFMHEPKEFKTYSQSKSAVVQINDVYTYQTVLFGNKDYIFNLCTEKGYKALHFKITNSKTNELIYDNIDDKYNQSIGFTVKDDITVNVEATILSEKETKIDPNKKRVCLGIQILWRLIPKIGF